MRHLITLLFLLGLSQACLSHPGAGHSHTHEEPAPVTSKQAENNAKMKVDKKVSQGKIAASWLKIAPGKAYKKNTERGEEWVVEFHDPKGPKGRTKIYVNLGLTGYVTVFRLTGE